MDAEMFLIRKVVDTFALALQAIKSLPLNETDWWVEIHFLGGKSYDYLLYVRCIFIVNLQPWNAYTDIQLSANSQLMYAYEKTEGAISLYCSLASINFINTILYLPDGMGRIH